MRSRQARLTAALPGASPELVTELAGRPVAEVDRILAAVRQAKRDALAADKRRRAQRRADARAHRWYDESQLEARSMAILDGHGRRAEQSLDALAALARFERHIDTLKMLAVPTLRAQGHSDGEIAAALGITRQGVSKRFQRQPGLHLAETPAESA